MHRLSFHFRLFALLILPLVPLSSHSEPAGRDFFASTPAEIQSIMRDSAQPGDTVVMRNGEWSSVTVTFEGDGTEERPITLRAETPGEVILTGQSRLRIGGRHLVVDGLLFTDGYLTSGSIVEFRTPSRGNAQDCRLTNTGFVRFNPPDRTTNYKWVSLFGQRNRVDHCRFSGMDHVGQAITVWLEPEPNDHRIDHNFFGPRPPLGMNGGEMIRIGDSSSSNWDSRTTVEYNLFYECDGEGEIISSKSNENVFRYNTFIRSAGALTLRHGKRNRVEGNYFLGDGKAGTGGVRLIDSGHVVVNNYFHGLTGRSWTPPLGIMNGKPDALPHEHFPAHDSLVAHNTFVDCERPVIIGLGAEREALTLAPQNVRIFNNVFTSTVGPIIEMRDANAEVHWAANFVFGAPVGIPRTAGVEQLDPHLERGPDGIFRPGTHSPARGAGIAVEEAGSTDIEARDRAEPADAGSHTILPGEARRLPVGLLDVGPSWMRTGWEKWTGSFFSPAETSDLARLHPQAKADASGLQNVLSYAFGARRGESRKDLLPRTRILGGDPIFEYRRNPHASEIEFMIEVSPDLREWQAPGALPSRRAVDDHLILESVPLAGMGFARLRLAWSDLIFY
jgi:poly(beta-D-mannuronate) lyase